MVIWAVLGCLSHHPTGCRLHIPDNKKQTARRRTAELQTDNTQTHRDAETQDEVNSSQPGGPSKEGLADFEVFWALWAWARAP